MNASSQGVGWASRQGPALVYLGFALAFVWLASFSHPFAFVSLWVALSLFVLTFAYLTSSTWVLGKKSDGQMNLASLVVLFPYLCFVWGFYHFKCLVQRRNEPAWHQIRPGLYIGRRPRRGELPPATQRVIDLTSEFCEEPSIVADVEYRCLPVLNRSAPDDRDFASLLQETVDFRGVVFVHCGAGRGRATMFVAALLILRREVRDLDAALAELAKARAGVYIHPVQRRAVERLCFNKKRPQISE